MIVNLESLVEFLHSTELAQEWEVFSWILGCMSLMLGRILHVSSIYLLCMLSNHQHQRKIVHPESSIKQSISVNEKDDIFDSIFYELWISFYRGNVSMWV